MQKNKCMDSRLDLYWVFAIQPHLFQKKCCLLQRSKPRFSLSMQWIISTAEVPFFFVFAARWFPQKDACIVRFLVGLILRRDGCLFFSSLFLFVERPQEDVLFFNKQIF